MLKLYKFLLLTVICISSVCKINIGYCNDNDSVSEHFFSCKSMQNDEKEAEQIQENCLIPYPIEHIYQDESYDKISVGMDISVTEGTNSAEAGIVVAGLTSDGKIHILNDLSGDCSTSNSNFYNMGGKKYAIEDISKYDKQYKFKLAQVDNYYNTIVPNEINLAMSIDENNKELVSPIEAKIKGIVKQYSPSNLVFKENGNSEYVTQVLDKIKSEKTNLINMTSVESSKDISTVISDFYNNKNTIFHTHMVTASELEKQMMGEFKDRIRNINALYNAIYGLYYNDNTNVESFNSLGPLKNNIEEVTKDKIIDKCSENQDENEEYNSDNISKEQNNNIQNYDLQSIDNDFIKIMPNNKGKYSDNESNHIKNNNKNKKLLLMKRERNDKRKLKFSTTKYNYSSNQHGEDTNFGYNRYTGIGKQIRNKNKNNYDIGLEENINISNDITSINERKKQISNMMKITKTKNEQYIDNIFKSNKYYDAIKKIQNNLDDYHDDSIKSSANFLNKCEITLTKIKVLLREKIRKKIREEEKNNVSIRDIFIVLGLAVSQYDSMCVSVRLLGNEPTFATNYSSIILKKQDLNNNAQLKSIIDLLLVPDSLVRQMLINFSKLRREMNLCTKYNNMKMIDMNFYNKNEFRYYKN